LFRRRPGRSGKVYPFVFITIACGAISGFHALISSGTTPKMIAKETDARMIGYGSMLMEGLVGVVALIAATSLFPGDYFAINTPSERLRRRASTCAWSMSKAPGLRSSNARIAIAAKPSQARRTSRAAPEAR
jgi:carbon starvation protein